MVAYRRRRRRVYHCKLAEEKDYLFRPRPRPRPAFFPSSSAFPVAAVREEGSALFPVGATEEEPLTWQSSSSSATRRGAFVSAAVEGTRSRPSLKGSTAELIRQLNSPLSSQQQPHSPRNKKERYFVASPLFPSSDTFSSPSSPAAACPFVRQSDSPSVLRGLLPLPSSFQHKVADREPTADGDTSAVSNPAAS